jgi:hypothetical protein
MRRRLAVLALLLLTGLAVMGCNPMTTGPGRWINAFPGATVPKAVTVTGRGNILRADYRNGRCYLVLRQTWPHHGHHGHLVYGSVPATPQSCRAGRFTLYSDNVLRMKAG